MVKYLLILVNSFVIFIYGLLSDDGGIRISSKVPEKMSPGEETSIEITVHKGSMSGFAKLQVDLPEGFSVKESEEKGATYTLNDNIAKWVWAVLPSDEEIVIKMVIVPGSDISGKKTINAKYSYVENNVKQVVEMDPAEFIVGEGGEQIVQNKEEPASPPVESPVPVQTAELPAVTSNNEGAGNVSAERKVIPNTAAFQFTVQLTINKGSTKGFARYSDELPNDVIVTEAQTDGSSFSVADGKIKFVWVNVPEKEVLEISYVISSKLPQTVDLKGEYSYLEDNQSKKVETAQATLTFEAAKLAEDNTPATTEEPKEQPIEKVAEAKKEKKPDEKKSASKPAGTQPQSAPMGDQLVYQVQIGAFSKRKVTVEKLEKRFNISEPIRSEMQGGFSKFMVGSHQEYKEARDHRESVVSSNKIKSSFVVAYNHGKRITVQEALMVSNQKWFK